MPSSPPPSPVLRALLVTVVGLVFGGFAHLTVRLLRGDAPVFDPDSFWALEAGRWMLANGDVPRTNLFSYTAPDHPWIFHEWLYGLLLALGYEQVGLDALWWAAGLNTAVVFGLLAMLVARARTPGETTASLLGIGLVLTQIVPGIAVPRPTYMAWACPLALLLLATRKPSRLSLALLVVVQAVWMGLHGSFVVGWGLLAVLALEGRRSLWGVLAVSVALVPFNPYGLGMLGLVGDYAAGVGTAAVTNREIVEFWPVWRTPFSIPLALALGGSALAAALSARSHPLRALLVAGLLVLSLLQVRHATLTCLVVVVLLQEPVGRRLGGLLLSRVERAGIALVAALLVLPAFWTTEPAPVIRSDPGFLAAMETVPDGANLYVPFGYGGTAIHLGRPRGIRVFYDERNDCYPPDVAQHAFDMVLHRTLTADPLLLAHHTDVVLLQRSHAQALYFKTWRREPVADWIVLRPPL